MLILSLKDDMLINVVEHVILQTTEKTAPYPILIFSHAGEVDKYGPCTHGPLQKTVQSGECTLYRYALKQ